jgi:hypothetical protein
MREVGQYLSIPMFFTVVVLSWKEITLLQNHGKFIDTFIQIEDFLWTNPATRSL